MNIIPDERPNPRADALANWIVAIINQSPAVARRVTRMLVGPAFTALDASFAHTLQALRQELDLLANRNIELSVEKNIAEAAAATLELRVAELAGNSEVLDAVRSVHRNKQDALLERLHDVDVRFAKCRDEKRSLERQMAEAARERTGAAKYIVELEDRIAELTKTAAA